MMITLPRLLILASLITSGCTTTNIAPAISNIPADQAAISRTKPWTPVSVEITHQMLIGDWHGSQPAREGGRVEWIMRRSGDGTFMVTFRNFDSSGRQQNESTEVGYWGVSGDLILTHTMGWLNSDGSVRTAPADDPYFWDAYRIRELTSERIHYVSVESGNEYRVTRIAAGTGFPVRE